ncbi:lipid transferase CIDEB-like [Poecile atricapillus]|uniref:lipid transferase CIDEB-like n=1 Tax=Poecile atricapillus TaxID=48891 RepID=UPI0027386AD3|nr:lipid transferase CIDEB-like [Poecile atricapillus]
MEALRSAVQRFWDPSPPRPSPTPARPFWVSPGGVGEGRARVGEGRPRGVLAATLGELREQVSSVLALPPPLSLVLAEDGTLLENEEFFGTLPPHTALQALGPGQRWEPPQDPPSWDLGGGPGGLPQPQIRGLRLDLGGFGTERLLRELLRWLVSLSRALGQALLGVSGALRPLLEGPQTQPGER